MSSRKLITYAATAFFAAAIGVMACKKDNNTNTTPTSTEDLSYASEDARLEQYFDEVQAFADQAATLGTIALKGESVLGGSCVAIITDTAKKTIVMDFGKEECLCKDGRKRRGMINVAYTGKYTDSGSVHAIDFTDYFVNGNQLMGTKTIANMGHNKAGQLYTNIDIYGSIKLAGDTGTLSRIAKRQRTLVLGGNTPIATDDVFTMTGSGSFTNKDGKTINATIKSPIEVAVNCTWIRAGIVEFSYDNLTRVLDYGIGACEDQATIRVNGNTENITLK